MPMLLLAIRIEIELIFKNSFPEFFQKEQHERVRNQYLNFNRLL